MIATYTAAEAKAAADAYYAPLNQIFEFVKRNSKEGMYSVVVSGVELTATQINVLKKCGYTVSVSVDNNVSKYQLSWSE